MLLKSAKVTASYCIYTPNLPNKTKTKIMHQALHKCGGTAIAAIFLAICNSAQALTYSSAPGTYNIPSGNNTGVTVPIVLSGQPNIATFNSVTITGLTHPFYGGLRAILSNGDPTRDRRLFGTSIGPDFTFTQNNSLDLSGDYTFAENGANWYTQTVTPVPTTTTYASLDSLIVAFNNTSANTTWTLNIQDRSSGNIGSFSQWSFDVTPTTPVPFEFSPALGLGILGAAFLIKKKLDKKAK